MAVAVTVPVAAQQAVVLDNHASIKTQVRFFEQIIQGAVRRGGEMLEQEARKIEPRVGLQMAGAPLVSGVYLPDQGYHFDAQVPDIGPTSLSMWVYYAQQSRAQQPTRVVSNGGVVADDPLKAPATDPTPPFDVGREYGNCVRQSLVDAMIDSSGALPLKSGERLTVRARVPQIFQDPRVLSNERELLLVADGADLLAYRQGTLTRDQLKDRIREYRY
ncbi:MAG: hypothetical protein R2752_01315 [Vicinamibacterales bacterium]